MKPKVDLPIDIKFTPVYIQNKKTGDYVMHYKEFPQAIAPGKTEREAELNLIEIFITILEERKEKIREQSLNKYYTN